MKKALFIAVLLSSTLLLGQEKTKDSLKTKDQIYLSEMRVAFLKTAEAIKFMKGYNHDRAVMKKFIDSFPKPILSRKKIDSLRLILIKKQNNRY